MTANPPLSPMPSGTQAKAPGTEEVDPDEVPNKVANFLGTSPRALCRKRQAGSGITLSPTRWTSCASRRARSGRRGHDLRATPGGIGSGSPYVFYGETVSGKYDPAQPGVIAIHATIDGKEVSGYVDAAKLWLEPPLDAPRSERYMAVGEVVAVHVLPSLSSPPALTLLQGEVVDAVGVLNFRGGIG